MPTNTELLKETKRLSGLDGQRQFLLRQHIASKPCPGCGTKNNVFHACGVEIDAFDVDGRISDYDLRCAACGVELIRILPFPVGDWFWSLKARAETATLPALGVRPLS